MPFWASEQSSRVLNRRLEENETETEKGTTIRERCSQSLYIYTFNSFSGNEASMKSFLNIIN